MANAKSLLGLLCLASLSSWAGQVSLDTRADELSYNTNDAVGKPGYDVFQVTRLKIDFQGNLGDSNFFRVRIDPLNNSAAASVRDKTSKFVDFGFVKHKFNDNFSFAMGKIITGMGGTEGSNNPGDIYVRSVAGDEAAAIYWPVGAQVEWTEGVHNLRLNLANNTEDVVTTGTYLEQTRKMVGLTYTSKVMDGMVIPNFSYHTEKLVSGTTSAATSNVSKTNSYFALGARVLSGAWEFEIDGLKNKYDLDPQSNTNVLETGSLVGLARYKFDGLGSTFVKVEGTSQKKATSATADTTNKISVVTWAFEYKPVKEENWRLHLALAQKDTKPDTGDTQTEKYVYVGMRLLADFLKY